jgi:hypothetical protein
LLALAARPAAACIWDSDTAAVEARGLPEVVDVIAGRFEQSPPLFYEMRLARVTARIQADGRDLDAHDDAGAACDRLGRSDEAIAWMERKRAALDALSPHDPRAKEHRYRTLANLGTFHVHRWIRAGARRDDTADLRRSRDLLAEAIALNPDAHFGRERYQLLAVEAALDGVGAEPGAFPVFLERRDWSDEQRRRLRRSRHTGGNQELAALGYADAVRGLSGLVVLGNAWESVDVFHALAAVLQVDGRSSLAYLARLRVAELLAQHRRSLIPGAGAPDVLREAEELYDVPLEGERLAELRAAYASARRSAEEWRAAREAFMLRRLREGRHPDTDTRFWDGFAGGSRPRLPGDGLVGLVSANRLESGALAVLVLGAALLGFSRLARRRGERRDR